MSRSPADKPGLVSDLVDLPTGRIVKIAANGYLVAALTSGNDLYCWGGHPAQEPVAEGLPCGCPYPVALGDHDIIDVGVGESHMIALTADGQVYVIGVNQNGQLGLDIQHRASDWAKVDLGLHESQKIKGVAAGSRNSFIIVDGLRP
jgi:alpha-tubulin suppressor-like RCC1 family protein